VCAGAVIDASRLVALSDYWDFFYMGRGTIDVGAFRWSWVQRLCDADPMVHWQRYGADGLQCPLKVFTQLFHVDATDADFSALVRAVDYSAPGASPLAH